MTTTNLGPTLNERINQLEAEISQRQRDIGLLKDALEAVGQNKPRPQQPSADSIHALLTEMIGAVPQNLEEQRLYSAKLEAAKSSLQSAIDDCRRKADQLAALHQQKQEQQQAEAFDQLKLQAERFNELIDQAMEQLQEMRSLAKQAGSAKFEITAELNEQAYCQITANSVKLRRRFDVLRG